jgi:hypothetical protein
MNFERNQMSQFPVELGLPQWLTHLANSIFEGLPKDEAPQFRKDLLAAIPVGLDLAIDLKPVRNKFLLAVQQRNLARLKNNEEPYAAECREAIGQVIEYLKNPNPESAEIAIESAETAWSAETAVTSAWYAKAVLHADSAESTTRSAWYAAWYAAESAAKSAVTSAWSAKSAEYRKQRDDLLEIIRELTV